MQEENINFEEIGKNGMKDAEQNTTSFKQPIRGIYKNMYAELKAKCGPQNFMNPYEPDKVSKANELYSRLLETDEKDETRLKELRTQAMYELGVRFSTEKLYKLLIDACNPQNFTGDNYNKELLDIANKLYQEVLTNADNILSLEELEYQAKGLVHFYNLNILPFKEKITASEEKLFDFFMYLLVGIIILSTILFIFLYE